MPRPPQEEFAAFVGIDWADAKHDVCCTSRWRRHTGVQSSRTHNQRPSRRGHMPSKSGSQDTPSRCVSNSTKALSSMPSVQYEFLVLFPVNPGTLAKYREAFTPSHAKDDPTDAELQLELLLKHRDKLQPLIPQSAAMRALEHTRRTSPPSGRRQSAPDQPPHPYAEKLLPARPAMV